MNLHLKSRFFLAIAWIGRHEFTTLLGIILIAGGLWTITAIADEVSAGDTESVDMAILSTMRSAEDSSDAVGPGWVEELGRDFTAIGSLGVPSETESSNTGLVRLYHQLYQWSCYDVRGNLLDIGCLAGPTACSLRLKAYFILLAMILSICVGISRVYLGVHWPTDVLAGWTLDASSAMLCWLAALRLQRKGQIKDQQIS